MTWNPLQAALKMSTLPGTIRATLDGILDHINAWKDPSTGRTDPTRPQTLVVYESLTQLAADTGFSTVSVADHLKRLRGAKPLRKGLKLVVLELVEEATHHRAARYRLHPEALDTLVDRERLKAFEQSEHKPNHPYQLWRNWRAADSSPPPGDPAETVQGISYLHPEDEIDDGQGISRLYAEEGQGISRLSPRVQAAYTEFTLVVDPIHQLTPFLPDPNLVPHPKPPPEKKVSPGSPSREKGRRLALVKTPPPQDDARRRLIEELTSWAAASEGHAPGVNAKRILDLWLFDCEAKHYAFPNWLGEGKRQLRQAYYDAQDKAEREARRHSFGLDPLREPPRAPRLDDADWRDPEAPVSHHWVCGMTHQRGVPCPQVGRQTTPMAAD